MSKQSGRILMFVTHMHTHTQSKHLKNNNYLAQLFFRNYSKLLELKSIILFNLYKTVGHRHYDLSHFTKTNKQTN